MFNTITSNKYLFIKLNSKFKVISGHAMRMKVKITESCMTLCYPTDGSLPGSSVHEIFQARILEWVAKNPLTFM